MKILIVTLFFITSFVYAENGWICSTTGVSGKPIALKYKIQGNKVLVENGYPHQILQNNKSVFSAVWSDSKSVAMIVFGINKKTGDFISDNIIIGEKSFRRSGKSESF